MVMFFILYPLQLHHIFQFYYHLNILNKLDFTDSPLSLYFIVSANKFILYRVCLISMLNKCRFRYIPISHILEIGTLKLTAFNYS